MRISPGTELVWSLAGREAITARVAEVEPDHFFCAMLKFTELDDEDLERVTSISDAKILADLAAERDNIQAAVLNLPKTSQSLRHEIRRLLKRGEFQYEGGVLHRSEASRQLFERAAQLARQDQGLLKTEHLLLALLDRPTEAMGQALGEFAKPPEWLGELPEPEPEEQPEGQELPWATNLQELASTGAFAISEVSAPQIRVLAWAMQDGGSLPILLICDAQVQAAPLLWHASQEMETSPSLYLIDQRGMLLALDEEEQLASGLADILAQADKHDRNWLVFEATERNEEAEALLVHLKPLLARRIYRLILALSAACYHHLEETEQDLESCFRPLWLHDLENIEVPQQL